MAGHYCIEHCVIPVASIVERAGVDCLIDRIVELNVQERTACTEGGQVLSFDCVSIDTGAVLDAGSLQGVDQHGIALRPIEGFIDAWQRVHQKVMSCSGSGSAPVLSVIGGGAAGVEIMLAMAWRFKQERVPVHLQMVVGLNGVLSAFSKGSQNKVRRCLEAMNVSVVKQVACAVCAHEIVLEDDLRLVSDHTVVATGTAAAQWPRAAGLAADALGFIAVNTYLQSMSHPFVFAAGDCATMQGYPRAKSGVYAVRAGPHLAVNLKHFLVGGSLRAYVPQARALYLLATGGRHAIANWGPMSIEGNWVWRWKDWIDRRFIRKYVN